MTKYAKNLVAGLLAVMAVLVFVVAVAPKANAVVDPLADPCTSKNQELTTVSPVCADKNKTANPLLGPEGIITKVIQILVIILGIVAVIVIIVAGLSFVLSSGDPAKISTAKNAIIYACIGLVVAGLSQSIVLFVLNRV